MLTDENLKLTSNRNIEWKIQEAERKARHEKIEAEKKAEAERKATEEVKENAAEGGRRQSSQQQAPKYTQTPAYSGGSNTQKNNPGNYHLAPTLKLLLVDTATTAPMLQATHPQEAKPTLITGIKAGEATNLSQ